MRIPLAPLLLAASFPSIQAATTYTEDFSLGLGAFVEVDPQNITETNTSNNDLTFTNGNGQNQTITGLNGIDNFQFTASTTQGLSSTIDNFTVSNLPIPEPSAFLLSFLALPALLLQRRRA